MLAEAEAFDILKKITDQPWPGYTFNIWGMEVTLMSRAIGTMILVAVTLLFLILPAARKYKVVPTGGRNVLEIVVLFVRDMIARPALHDRAYRFMPFLLTMFVFVLGMNLAGMFPIEGISETIAHYVPRLHGKSVGGTPTGVLTVCGGLAAVTTAMVIFLHLKTQAVVYHHRKGWPMIVCILLSPVLFLVSLSPPITGVTGIIMKVPMIFIEVVGILSRCIALMIRLFANMVSGHTLLAVFLMLIVQSGIDFIETGSPPIFYVFPICVGASVAISLLELLVVALQAYVFTFLTAIFLSLAMEEGH